MDLRAGRVRYADCTIYDNLGRPTEWSWRCIACPRVPQEPEAERRIVAPGVRDTFNYETPDRVYGSRNG
jgi:hypothetical protein